ncbi:MAG: hypothetical protein IKF39_12775 [Oscillospiraceae bacterium]|nr:hypothetical protein [Oscillospiraceae bacterium]
MSLDKAIFYMKEHRKPYKGAKAVSRSCRNHGGCLWCEGNRMYRFIREKERTSRMLQEYKTTSWIGPDFQGGEA